MICLLAIWLISRNRRVLRDGGRDGHFILNCIDFHLILLPLQNNHTVLTESYILTSLLLSL